MGSWNNFCSMFGDHVDRFGFAMILGTEPPNHAARLQKPYCQSVSRLEGCVDFLSSLLRHRLLRSERSPIPSLTERSSNFHKFSMLSDSTSTVRYLRSFHICETASGSGLFSSTKAWTIWSCNSHAIMVKNLLHFSSRFVLCHP